MSRSRKEIWFAAIVVAVAFFCLASTAEAAPPSTDGLQAYWSFDEGTGSTTSDSSGNGRTGSTTTGVTWGTGQISNAVNFNKTNGFVSASADFIGSGAMTVSGWIKPRSTGQNSLGRILDNGQTLIRLTGTTAEGRLTVSSNGGTTGVHSANNAVATSTDTWTFFVVARDADGLVNIYINDVLSGAANQNAGATSSGSWVYIGNRAGGTATFDGAIDDLRVYNRVLSASERTDLYVATASYPDTIAPTLSSGSPTGVLAAGTTQTTLSVVTSENATCKYGTVAGTAYASIANTFTTTGATNHSATITGLTDGASYTYYVRCQDASANTNTNTSDYSISFSVADEVAPIISNVTASNVRQTTAVITWTTNESSTSTVSYGTTQSYGSASTSASMVTSHSIRLTGLTENTLYHFRVSSEDASGNVATSSDATFTTRSWDTWYVNATSTGAGDGTSVTDAWTSFSAINQSQLSGEDVVLVYSGTYNERFTISKSGTGTTTRLTYKGVDTGGGMPVLRGINTQTHDYLAIIGFEITQTSTANNYPAINLGGSDSLLIQDNYIHDTYFGGITSQNSTVSSFNILRGNTLDDIGSVDNGSGGGGSVVNIVLNGNYNLVEYNTITRGMDRIRFFGTGNMARNNYFGATDSLFYPSSVPYPHHTDGFQSFESATFMPLVKFLWEKNYDTDNIDTDGLTNAHGFLIQDGGTNGFNWALLRFNILIRPGGAGYTFRNMNRIYGYNNTSIQIQKDSTSLFQTIVAWENGGTSDIADWRNNAFNYSPKTGGGVFTLGPVTNFTSGYNQNYNTGALPAATGNLANTDPLFTDGTGVSGHDNYKPQSSSPLRSAGGPITTASGSGTNATSLTVADSRRLFDGWYMAEGDLIKIGSGAYVRISSINYDTNVVTLSAARSWSDGDEVRVKGAEDIGALPYSYTDAFTVSLDNSYLPAGSVNFTATVSNTDAVRMVEYLVDDIPVGISYDYPYTVSYTADGQGHEVTARAYNAWASSTLSVSDSNQLSPQAPAIPTLTSQAASSVTTSSATLNGNITDIGSASPTVRGFAYGTASNLSTVIATTSSSGSFSTGAFTGSVSSLTCNTTYYFRPYATNSSGTGFGSILSFVTSSCPASSISFSSSERDARQGYFTSSGSAAANVSSSTSATTTAATVVRPFVPYTLASFIETLIALGIIPQEKAAIARAALQTPASPFSRNLKLKDRGEDVRALQKFLNAKGFRLAAEGPGSPGFETNMFGAATYRALKKYQASLGIPNTGYFGPLTRASIKNE